MPLPHGLHCYRPPDDAPPVGALPAAARGHVTFGSFNKLGKVSDATVALWAQVLAAVPDARLVIKSKALAEAETRDFTLDRFARQGVAPARLDLLAWVPDDAGHLGAYRRIDIALDTFPYSGTTTTCEALWMGVPVLTLAGPTHAGRVSASVLTGIGLRDWITTSAAAFVAKAAAYAADITSLRNLRAALRANLRASSLCDGAGYARAVESAYRAMWTHKKA
jgi:predicted O-linked N-acetylglucosamine transferase (SPINDLY family)